jgi:hypothetical protein
VKVLIINASPKPNGSASGQFADLLLKRLRPDIEKGQNIEASLIAAHSPSLKVISELKESLVDSQAIVWILPLYVDSLPAHMLFILEEILPSLKALGPSTRLYAVINCGFWEPEHVSLAMNQMRLLAAQSSLTWGQGLAFGGGAAVESAPWGLFFRGFDRAITTLAKSISEGSSQPDLLVKIGLPRWLYILSGNFRWKIWGRRNGLKAFDLYRRP